jgi:hypothetical protein
VGGTSFKLLSLTCIYCRMQTIKEVRVMEAVKVNLNYDETQLQSKGLSLICICAVHCDKCSNASEL